MSDAPRICRFEGCSTAISRDNTSGMCRIHVHRQGCLCAYCRGGWPRYRLKTRAELIAEGLLGDPVGEGRDND